MTVLKISSIYFSKRISSTAKLNDVVQLYNNQRFVTIMLKLILRSPLQGYY